MDASEKKDWLLDERLLQSHKLAAIGELSAGIAHEINNPLAIIRQEAEWMQLLLKKLGDGKELEELQGSVHQIVQQVDRCTEITRNLLDFARKRDPVIQAVEVNRVIEDMTRLVEKEAKHNNALRARCGLRPARITSYQTARGTAKAIAAKCTYQSADQAAPLSIACLRVSATCTKVKTPFCLLTNLPAGVLQLVIPCSYSSSSDFMKSTGLRSVVPSTPTPSSPAMRKDSGLEAVCHSRGCGFCKGRGTTSRSGI